jgi:hypothetical protein
MMEPAVFLQGLSDCVGASACVRSMSADEVQQALQRARQLVALLELQEQEPQLGLCMLPVDMIVRILALLPIHDLSRASLVCRLFGGPRSSPPQPQSLVVQATAMLVEETGLSAIASAPSLERKHLELLRHAIGRQPTPICLSDGPTARALMVADGGRLFACGGLATAAWVPTDGDARGLGGRPHEPEMQPALAPPPDVAASSSVGCVRSVATSERVSVALTTSGALYTCATGSHSARPPIPCHALFPLLAPHWV